METHITECSRMIWTGVSVCLRKAVIVILLEEQSDGAESAFSKPRRVSSGLGSFIFFLFFYEDTHSHSLQWLLLHTHSTETYSLELKGFLPLLWFSHRRPSIHLQLPSSSSILLPLSIDLQFCLLQSHASFFIYSTSFCLSFFLLFFLDSCSLYNSFLEIFRLPYSSFPPPTHPSCSCSFHLNSLLS